MGSCVGEFVDYQQAGSAEEPHAGGPPALQSGLAASFGQLVGAGEIDPVTGLGCGAGHPDGQHRLTGAGWSDEHHIAGVIEEAQRGQLADEFLVDAGCAVKSNVSRLDWVGRQANRSRDANRRAWVVSTSTASSCSSTVTVEASWARAASRMPGNASAAAGSFKKSRCCRSR